MLQISLRQYSLVNFKADATFFKVGVEIYGYGRERRFCKLANEIIEWARASILHLYVCYFNFTVDSFSTQFLDSWLIPNFRIIEIEVRKLLFVFYNYSKYFIGNSSKALKYLYLFL